MLNAPVLETAPFVKTTVARLMLHRMRQTHEERGITVISGPWGIGKTTAIDAFAREFECQCAVVKVEPGPTKRGATGGGVMLRTVQALRALAGRSQHTQLSNSTWTMRQMIYNLLDDLIGTHEDDRKYTPFTFIFDEAQYLSREAIELLRFWNDRDRTTTPFPVGLIFVGNNEFALAESLGGESVLSGAVRSRLLFEVPLGYAHVNDIDLTLFAQSRGIIEPAAIGVLIRYFSQARIKRDLRNVERLIAMCHRRAVDGVITSAIVQSVLDPA